ncbi:MAG: ABC transporter permease [Clostridia bacterium]|jgi:ABC-type nitrate/sulfonate/bicarbonate transport system permease component|nr:ABC transporter permease [Clostridiales bacterium]
MKRSASTGDKERLKPRLGAGLWINRLVNAWNNRGLGPQLVAGLILTALWEAGVRLGGVPTFILPAPSQVVVSLVKNFPVIADHTRITLYEAMTGFVIAVLLSFVLAFIMDSVPVIKKALYPVLVISQTIPIITIAPLFVIWFGYGLLPKVIVVMLVCFFPMVVSFMAGLQGVDGEMYDLLKSMGASRMQIFRLLKLPGALPSLFSGMKISAAYSIMGAVIGEWLGARAGLGEFMRRSMHSFAVDKTFAAIIVITVLSLAVFEIIKLLEGWLMPWAKFSAREEQ